MFIERIFHNASPDTRAMVPFHGNNGCFLVVQRPFCCAVITSIIPIASKAGAYVVIMLKKTVPMLSMHVCIFYFYDASGPPDIKKLVEMLRKVNQHKFQMRADTHTLVNTRARLTWSNYEPLRLFLGVPTKTITEISYLVSRQPVSATNVKIGQRSPFFWCFFFGIHCKRNTTLLCHDAARCNTKTMSCTIHCLIAAKHKWLQSDQTNIRSEKCPNSTPISTTK